MRYKQKIKFKPKPLFVERMKKLIPDWERFFELSYTPTPDSIRCNTLKISPENLKKRLENYGWKIKQPFSKFPEIMIIENRLGPGEIGTTKEHLLGYYYVQEISSMLPIIALRPKEGDLLLDLCASPGSKTTQAAAMMENRGTIIANDKEMKRIVILSSNLEKCGVMNTIVTRMDGVHLCEKLQKKSNLKFDKILIDASCSGEGTLRKSIKTFQMWNIKMIEKLARLQKKLAASALGVLKSGGEMVYSTCTLTPEENEGVIDFLIKNFDVEIIDINLGLKTRQGILEWGGKKFDKQVSKCHRLYPQDNDTDGFFVCKLRKKS